jgi:hypothetical protein
MRNLMVAFLATLVPLYAQAKPKDNDQPKGMTAWAFRAGKNPETRQRSLSR